MMACIFCEIAGGRIPARRVFEDEHCLAFHDLHPHAPVHILVIPKLHLDGLQSATMEHGELLGRLLLVAQRVAELSGCAESGYRVLTNSGADAGQTVSHLHLHVMGGARLSAGLG